MSYAGLGAGEVTSSGVVTAAMTEAKKASLSMAVQVGIPADVFSIFEDVTRGAQNVYEAVRAGGSGATAGVKSLLASKGISVAHQVARQLGGTKALDDATKLPPGTTDLILGFASGSMPDLGPVCSVIGAAVGTALCGPLCGIVGGMVGTVAAEVIGEVGDGIADLFGSTSKDRRQYEADMAAASEIRAIKEDLYRYSISVIQSVQYGVARIYNRMLELGVQDFDPAFEVHEALGPGGDRHSYAAAHDGLQPEQVVVQQKQWAFVQRVHSAINKVSSGLWERNALESGWKENVHDWVFDGETPRLEQVHVGTKNSVWCTWQEAGFSPCLCQDSRECGPVGSQQYMNALCYTAQDRPRATTAWWQCHNRDDAAQRRYRPWLRNAADWYGKEWGTVATRDCAVLMLKASLDKGKVAQAVDDGAAAAAAARLKAAADYMASVGAQQAQTKAAQTYIDSVNELRAQQTRDLAARQAYDKAKQEYDAAKQATEQKAYTAAVQGAKQAYTGLIAEFQAQMLDQQVVSRANILALQGKWTTGAKVLIAGGTSLVLAGVGVALYFWSMHRKRLAA